LRAQIMGDAAYEILTRHSRDLTGNFFIDDDVMRAAGVRDLGKYTVVPGTPDHELAPDFFV
jgi:citronellol/citronellal dehydrogenase